jgi:hypothetical protein
MVNLLISFLTNGIPWSLRSVLMVMYQEVLTSDCSVLDWKHWLLFILQGLAHLQRSLNDYKIVYIVYKAVTFQSPELYTELLQSNWTLFIVSKLNDMQKATLHFWSDWKCLLLNLLVFSVTTMSNPDHIQMTCVFVHNLWDFKSLISPALEFLQIF